MIQFRPARLRIDSAGRHTTRPHDTPHEATWRLPGGRPESGRRCRRGPPSPGWSAARQSAHWKQPKMSKNTKKYEGSFNRELNNIRQLCIALTQQLNRHLAEKSPLHLIRRHRRHRGELYGDGEEALVADRDKAGVPAPCPVEDGKRGGHSLLTCIASRKTAGE